MLKQPHMQKKSFFSHSIVPYLSLVKKNGEMIEQNRQSVTQKCHYASDIRFE